MPQSFYLEPLSPKSRKLTIVALAMAYDRIETDDGTLYTMRSAWTRQLHWPSAGSQCEMDEIRSWDDAETLAEWLHVAAGKCSTLHLVSCNIRMDLWASDLHDILGQRGWKLSFLYDQGRTTIIRCKRKNRRLTALSVTNWWPGDTATWADMCDIAWRWEDVVAGQEPPIAAYYRLQVVVEMMQSYVDTITSDELGTFRLTIASQAMACFRARYLRHKILIDQHPPLVKCTRLAFMGGRVECGLIGERSGVDLVHVDFNSLYPAVMSSGRFPIKLRQWVRRPSLQGLQEQLQHYCVIAKCRVRTEEPAYAVRRGEELVFPVGEFATWLCTDSLKYAYGQGHLVEIDNAMIFYSARIFRDYVSAVHSRRRQLALEGRIIPVELYKLLLNALFGKFAARSRRVVHSEPDPSRDMWRENASIPNDHAVENQLPAGWDVERDALAPPERLQAIRWSFMGVQQLEVEDGEGATSSPAIAAHITDAARMRLWQAIKTVGQEHVHYCDTDSLILDKADLPRLSGHLHDSALGFMRVIEEADSLTIHGPKHYWFGDQLTRSGMRAEAVLEDELGYLQEVYPKLATLLRSEPASGYPTQQRHYQHTSDYTKGEILDSGRTRPLRLTWSDE